MKINEPQNDPVTQAKSVRMPLGRAKSPDQTKMAKLAEGMRSMKSAISPPGGSEKVEEVDASLTRSLNPEVSRLLREPASSPETMEQMPTPSSVGPLSAGKADRLEEQQAFAEDEVVQSPFQDLFSSSLGEVNQSPTWRRLTDPKRRAAIEARLAPLNFSDLVIHGSVSQDIVIRDDYVFRLRTLKEYERRYTLEALFGIKGSDAYVQATQSLYYATCALEAINGREIPSHRVHIDDLTREAIVPELFEAKLQFIERLASPIFLDLLIQFDWLNERAHALLTIDNIKGF